MVLFSGPRVLASSVHATAAGDGWEIHGQETVASTPSGEFSKITLGQAFTIEWRLGFRTTFSCVLLFLPVAGAGPWSYVRLFVRLSSDLKK